MFFVTEIEYILVKKVHRVRNTDNICQFAEVKEKQYNVHIKLKNYNVS